MVNKGEKWKILLSYIDALAFVPSTFVQLLEKKVKNQLKLQSSLKKKSGLGLSETHGLIVPYNQGD